MSERRLSPADAVWFYSEFPGNHQTVSALMWMDREINPDEVRELLQKRLVDNYPTFHQRIRMSRNPLLMPHWEDDPEFSIDNHFEVIQLPEPGDKATLEALVSEQRSQLLDRDRPLWKFFLFQGYLQDGTPTSALHARIQHAIADGWALVRLVVSLADETSVASKVDVVEREPKRKRDTALKAAGPALGAVDAVAETAKAAAAKVAETATNVAGAVVGAVKEPAGIPAKLASGPDALSETLSIDLDPSRLMEFSQQVPDTIAEQFGLVQEQVLDTALSVGTTAGTVAGGGKAAVDFLNAPKPGKSILHGTVNGKKKMSWMDPVPLEPIKQAGKSMDATINDVLMGCTTNALRKYLLEKNALDVENLLVTVPISLRKPDEPLPRNLGNKFGLVTVLLPVGIADPKEQIRNIKDQIDEIKQSQLPVVSFGLVAVSALTTPDVERLLNKITQEQTAGVVTNVPGPRHELQLAGGVVKGAWGAGGMAGNMNLGVGLFSLNGELNFVVGSDTGITQDPERITELFVESVNEILALAAA